MVESVQVRLTIAPKELPGLDHRRVALEGVGHTEFDVVVADWEAEYGRRDGQRRGRGNNESNNSVGQHFELLCCSGDR